MSARVSCLRCGAKPRGAKVFHDRACPLRHEAAMTGEVLAVHASGPLVPRAAVPELTNLYDDNQLVPWLAFVGLGGRWCWAGQNDWRRWDGKKWKSVRTEHVQEAVRRALTELHDRTEPPGCEHLLTIQRMVRLREQVRMVVAVDGTDVAARDE